MGGIVLISTPPSQMVAAIFLSFQVYADVFGYSPIAVGTGIG